MAKLIGQSLGRYHILEQLGEGGMAIVYKAYDTRLETEVAVKVIRTENLPQNTVTRALKRFEQEAKALARLAHPNIIPIIDYGEHKSQPYLVMQYIPGGTLKDVLKSGVLNYQKATQLLLPIARGLDYAHRQNMIHRDVKPSNILITEDGEPMLTDFGVAKIIDNEATVDLTGTSMAVGTPDYMAPEQFQGKSDLRSDIYGLGVVFYEMVTGRKPYQADTPAALIIKQATDPLPRPSKFISSIPDALEKVLIKTLAKSPDDRYQNMNEFFVAMENLLDTGKRERVSVSKPPKKVKKPRADKALSPHIWSSRKTIISIIGIATTIIVALFAPNLIGKWENTSPEPTDIVFEESLVALAELRDTVLPPTPTLQPTATPTRALTSTPTPLPEEIADIDLAGNEIPMRLVSAGEFIMGSDDGSAENEKPEHVVYLDTYYIDKFEITNTLFKACVDMGICDSPLDTQRYNYEQYGSYPVSNINWHMAQNYCEWRDMSLPSEAQWEKAARGTDGRTFPWGANIDCANLYYVDYVFGVGWIRCEEGIKGSISVGSYEGGKSPFEIYDMSGNVAEWVFDWYDNAYYETSPRSNPWGPESGAYKVFRGGSWNSFMAKSYTTYKRSVNNASYSDFDLGFRCAKEVTDASLSTAQASPTQILLPGAVLISYGQVITNTLPMNSAHSYAFEGKEGDKILVEIEKNTIIFANLKYQNEEALFSNTSKGNIEQVLLNTGLYYLTLRRNSQSHSSDSGYYELQVSVLGNTGSE
jgi:eukaryotic-like serine/threonine-protein kinase